MSSDPTSPPPTSAATAVPNASPSQGVKFTVSIGAVYRHAKGTLYRVLRVGQLVKDDWSDATFTDGALSDDAAPQLLHLARWEEDGAPVVVYRFRAEVYFVALRPEKDDESHPREPRELTTVSAVLYQRADDFDAQLWARTEERFLERFTPEAQ